MNVIELATSIALAFGTGGLDTVDCYTEPVTSIVNPGPGQYAVQYHFPFSSEYPMRVTAWGFLNNDGGTVWPSAGVLFIDPDSLSIYRFPTPSELQNDLQLVDVHTSTEDTTTHRMDFVTTRLDWQVDQAVVLVLKMPPNALVGVGEGPGFGAAPKQAFEHCSFFTDDGGSTWYESTAYSWAWVYEQEEYQATGVRFEPIKWGPLKRLYR